VVLLVRQELLKVLKELQGHHQQLKEHKET
jgi:hypothetical protein